MGRFEGKVAVVTGARIVDGEVGIGGAAARMIAAEGGRLVLADIAGDHAADLAAELNESHGNGSQVASGIGVDLGDEAQIKGMIDHAVEIFGGLDIVLNNAGRFMAADKDIATMDVAVWNELYAIDVIAPALAIKYALPAMLERGGGAVVNVSSIASLSGDLVRSGYGAAKAALNNVTLAAATQYGPQGIRVNAVIPGVTRTPPSKLQKEEILNTYRRHLLNPRGNVAEDVARVLVFLAGDDSAGISGELIRVDDGIMGHHPYVADFREASFAVAGVDNPR